MPRTLPELEDAARPIPPIADPDGWAQIPIVDSGDPLVELVPPIRIEPLYARRGIPGADAALRVRQGVRDALLQAAARLPDTLALCVFDGFRPLRVQRWLWDEFAAQLRAHQPELGGDALEALVSHFVASPDPDPLHPPPHRTGGAVDVYLVDAATGMPLPMGTEPDATVAASETRWFEIHPQAPFTANRRLLFHAMAGAGFVNYAGEWWHYEFGTRRWAGQARAAAAPYGDAETQAWEI